MRKDWMWMDRGRLILTQNEKDVRVDSAEFSCFGHQWILRLYPYGSYDDAMDPDEGYASIRLVNQSDSPISIYCGFSVRNARGKEVEFFEPDRGRWCFKFR